MADASAAQDPSPHHDAPGAPLELPGHAHIYSGKVRDLYAPVDPVTGESARRPAAPGRVRPDLGLRLRAGDTRARQGRGADAAVAVVVRPARRPRPDHVVSTDVPAEVAGRAVLVERLDMLPVECVGRAYLTGGGLGEYAATAPSAAYRSRAASSTAPGCRSRSSPRRPRRRGPARRADGYAVVESMLGAHLAERVRDLTVAILARGNEIAAERGILIADTKVEFGLRGDGSSCWPTRSSPRLVPVLAGRPVGARATRSRASTSSTSATG